MSYTEVGFTKTSPHVNDILIAMLQEINYDGFREENDELKAYIASELFNRENIQQLAGRFDVNYSVSELPDTNWNAVWESGFNPVTVEDFCAIRADFHPPFENFKHEIIITPKMSFGTGHHPTTYLMIQQMKNIDFENKRTLDFGTGTGILAILAKKMGSSRVVAIDNDNRSIENAEENIRKNHSSLIEIIKGDTPPPPGQIFDIILANITRNVILENIPLFATALTDKGMLLLSGLLSDDESYILNHAVDHGFTLVEKTKRNNWMCMKFRK